MITAKKGRTIYSQEEPAEVLFVLKRGRVQIYRLSPDRRKLTLAKVGPGTIFGEMSLVGQSRHSTYAEAIDEVTLCVMSRTDLERMLVSSPQVALRLLDLLARRMRELKSNSKGSPSRASPPGWPACSSIWPIGPARPSAASATLSWPRWWARRARR